MQTRVALWARRVPVRQSVRCFAHPFKESERGDEQVYFTKNDRKRSRLKRCRENAERAT